MLPETMSVVELRELTVSVVMEPAVSITLLLQCCPLVTLTISERM